MTHGRRHTIRRASMAGAVSAAALLAGATPALAKTKTHAKPKVDSPPAAQAASRQTANASFSNPAFQVDFTAVRAAGARETQATGHFHAVMRLSQNGSQLANLDGPVTCLDVRGDHVGLFYPVTSSVPSALGTLFKGVYIYAQTGANGAPLTMTFVPSTSSTATSCDATTPGMLPITGGYLSLGS